MTSNPFFDKVVIVTGASAGIGKSLALQLAVQGAKVVLAARRMERLEQVAEECRLFGGEVLIVPTDVSDESQCKALVEKALAAFGRLDVLINNAGMGVTALLEDLPDLHLFKQTMDINFWGTVYCTYHALPYLKQTKGRIVAISSLGGKVPLPYNTPYISSKFALQGFFGSLRMEQMHNGVSVTVICPSWVVTEFHEVQVDKNGKPKGARGRAIYSKNTMTADRCAAITLRAAAHRRREVLMGPGVLATLLMAIAPGLVDWAAVNIFLKAVLRRAKANVEKSIK
jgi:short-subunit dehydrogenase